MAVSQEQLLQIRIQYEMAKLLAKTAKVEAGASIGTAKDCSTVGHHDGIFHVRQSSCVLPDLFAFSG